MKRRFFNKAMSFCIALMMIVAMIPMSVIGVSAEADVDVTAETVVIDSVEDWKAVAAVTDDTFEGQTVTLGADIAFGSEAAPVLFDTFSGTFLGNGHTVSGTTLEGINLIATSVVGGVIDGSDGTANSDKVMIISGFTVTANSGKISGAGLVANTIRSGATVANINVNDCIINGKYIDADNRGNNSALIVAQVGGDTEDSDPKNNFDDICSIIINCTVNNGSITADSQSGAIVGALNGPAYLKVVNCNVNGTALIGNRYAAIGAIIGKLNTNSHAVITGCMVDNNVTITHSAIGNGYAEGLGIIVGQAGRDDGVVRGSLVIENCKASGTITVNNNSAIAGGVIGVLGYTHYNDEGTVPNAYKTTEIKNNIVNVTILPATNIEPCVGGVVGTTYTPDLVVSGNTVSGTISGKTYTGGVVAYSANTMVVTDNTVFDATIMGDGTATGGIVGYTDGSITLSRNTVNANIKGVNNVGGILGMFGGTGTENFVIEGCNVSGTIQDARATAGNNFFGGILGAFVPTGAITSANAVKNCKTTAVITVASFYGDKGSGGIIGRWGNGSTDYDTKTLSLTVEDCYVGGTIYKGRYASSSATEWNGNVDKYVAGVIAVFNVVGSTVDINNIVVDMELNATYNTNATTAVVVGNIGGHGTYKPVFTIKNVSTTMDTDIYRTVLISSKNCYINEVNPVGSTYHVDASVAKITEEMAAYIVNADSESGRIIEIRDHVRCGLVQVSNEVDGKYMIRFIGTSVFDTVDSAHMTIQATLGNTVRMFEADCEAYDILTAHESAAQIARISSEAYGAEKFVAITVKNIPAADAANITFDITLTVTVGTAEYTASFTGTIPPAAAA